jgi:carboxyl-terminal processing protease
MERSNVTVFLVASCLLACRYDNTVPNKQPATSVDSVYSICKDVYFWNENLPNYSTEELAQFTSSYDILEKVKLFSTLHNDKPLDRWSFSIDRTAWRNIENNQTTGFGMNLVFVANDDLRVKIVYNQSDTYKKGLWRGAKILKIDNIAAAIENKDLILSALKKEQVSVEFENQAKIRETMLLTSSFFQKETIINIKILENKIGYFYFDIFAGQTATYNQLTQLFDYFKQQNIKELVVDLRYNHGGDGLMALQMANSIIPKSAENKVFTRVINNGKYSLLNYSLYFKTSANNLNLKRLFFITSSETASSSEVLINALQAVMDVKIIGTATHGKPFGFIGYSIGNDIVFPVAFKNVNDKGYGNYYDGIPVDFEVKDDVTTDFGDTQENCLQTVLGYIKTGKFTALKKNGRQNFEHTTISEQQIPTIFYIPKKPF